MAYSAASIFMIYIITAVVVVSGDNMFSLPSSEAASKDLKDSPKIYGTRIELNAIGTRADPTVTGLIKFALYGGMPDIMKKKFKDIVLKIVVRENRRVQVTNCVDPYINVYLVDFKINGTSTATRNATATATHNVLDTVQIKFPTSLNNGLRGVTKEVKFVNAFLKKETVKHDAFYVMLQAKNTCYFLLDVVLISPNESYDA